VIQPLLNDSENVTTTVTSSSGSPITSNIHLPEDGDYIIVVSGYSSSPWHNEDPVPYNLTVELRDDGNSDFGVPVTASGNLYEEIVPGNAAVNVELGSSDMDDDTSNLNSYENRTTYPIAFQGGLVPGQASQVVIDTDLFSSADIDVYTFRLAEGQIATLDIDSSILYGRDSSYLTLGVYNGDLEAITTVHDETDDTLAAAVKADPYFQVQALFGASGHESVVIDPSAGGLGTYYVVVGGDSTRGEIPYRLTITTQAPETVKEKASQLVYLAFDGGAADYLLADFGSSHITRPAFDASDYNLGNMRTALVAEIAARIEQIYRDAGLTADEIEFTTTKPSLGKVYSTVYFGGRLTDSGLFGLAEQVDRDNADREDMAVVMTTEISRYYMGFDQLSQVTSERFDQVATLLSNVGAHELGHILGLEHATEINTSDPNNLMGYNDYLEPQELETRNSPILFGYTDQIGFTNEIDMLLRNIGSGTAMGS